MTAVLSSSTEAAGIPSRRDGAAAEAQQDVGESRELVTATSRYINNASTNERLTLGRWSVRTGADEHKQYLSHGAGC